MIFDYKIWIFIDVKDQNKILLISSVDFWMFLGSRINSITYLHNNFIKEIAARKIFPLHERICDKFRKLPELSKNYRYYNFVNYSFMNCIAYITGLVEQHKLSHILSHMERDSALAPTYIYTYIRTCKRSWCRAIGRCQSPLYFLSPSFSMSTYSRLISTSFTRWCSSFSPP